MDPASRDRVRTTTEHHRKPPAPAEKARVLFAGSGELAPELSNHPIELFLEVTDAEGELATWFHDGWWTEMLARWAETPITVFVEPTPLALLHPVVLYEVEMLYRMAPQWRLVGYVYRDDLSTDDDVATLAGSAYQEVRFIDENRPGQFLNDRLDCEIKIEQLFARIRREQARVGSTRPALVRLPSKTYQPSKTATVAKPKVAEDALTTNDAQRVDPPKLSPL